MTRSFIIAFVVCVLASVAAGQNCPPVTTQSPFNITEYTRAPWYVQMMQPVVYLPPDEFYCVRAIYNQTGPTTVSVNNYACKGGVNQDPTGGPLCAVIPDASVPSKLAVGPCFLPKTFYGPYWVVNAGPDENNYQWALVSGGQPDIETPYGCRTGSGENGSGLWIFSRSQVAPVDQVEYVAQLAQNQGFDTTVLMPVEQQGCTYQS